MILTQLSIKGFGRLHDRTIAFAPGLTVIAGPNEAGKTTLVECIVRLLFGYPDRQYKAEWERFAPWSGGAHAAAIAYRLDDGRAFETHREFGRADIATMTYDVTTGRMEGDLCGSRSASPGTKLLELSLPAFEAAAVIRAADFAVEPPDADAYKLLAERLGAIVGAAGEGSAVAARDRLEKFITQLGGDPRATNSLITRARCETMAATHALEEYRREFDATEKTLAQRVALLDEIARLGQQLERVQADYTAAQLSGVRERLHRASVAEAEVARAQAGRDDIRASTSVAVAEPPDGSIETAVVDWRAAREAEHAAAQRVAAAKPQKAEAERSFTDALRGVGQANGKVSEIVERIAALPDIARYPDIPESALGEIEDVADRVAALEADADKKETIAAFSRQRRRSGSSTIAVLSLVVGAVAAGGGALMHLAPLLYAGIALLALGIVLLVLRMAGRQKQSAGVASSESTAREARERYQAAAKELQSRCGSYKCKDALELRDIHNAQQRAARLHEALDAARQAAAQAQELHAARAAHLDEFANFERQAQAAIERSQEREAQLVALLDGAGVSAGPVADRISAWREFAQSDKRFAQADAQVAKAEAARAEILGDRSIAEWHEEEKRLAEELRRFGTIELASNGSDERSTGDQGRALQSQLHRLPEEIAEKHKELSFVHGLLEDFQRRYPVGSSELEERLACAHASQNKFVEARKAAELARGTIAKLQDNVHRNFAPRLNQAVSEAAAAVTGGRYTEARVDPSDFSIRAITPERGVPAEEWCLSSGTREQLFLALRAAVAQSLAPGERLPLILDDALAHADDFRLPAAVAHLARMGEQGQQILLFTQRGDVVRAAQENGAAIVELEGPPGSPVPKA